MYGALYVVADLKSYLADPEAYLAEHPLPLRDELLKYNERNTEWTYDDLAAEVEALHESGAARSFQVGQSVFKVANCVACHKVGDEGFAIGPDLTKLQPDKNRPLYILRSLVEPDRDIDDNYRSHTFELDSGKTISGLVVAQTGDTISVAVDPIAKADPVVLEKSSIEVQTRLPTSIMPKGLLNRLSREEILDLIAFVHTGGNPKHALYKESHDHQH